MSRSRKFNKPAATEGWMLRRRKDLMSRPERHYCMYCSQKATGFDHVDDYARSKDNTSDNIVACCTKCNNFKKNRLLIIFLALKQTKKSATIPNTRTSTVRTSASKAIQEAMEEAT